MVSKENAKVRELKEKGLWDYASNISRRQFLKLMGYSGLAAGSMALGGSKVFGATNPVEIRYWASGTQSIEEHYKRLEEDLNIKMLFTDNGNATGPVISKMIAGDAANVYDVLGLQGGAEKELAQAETILPWDMSLIPNWDDDIWEWVRDIPYHSVNGSRYGIPKTINADSMIYNADKIPVVDTYAYVFDPALKGKTSMEDWWTNSVIFTAMYLKENNIQGLGEIKNPGDLEVDELEAVMEFLIGKKKEGQFRTFWSGWEQGVSLITREEVWVMMGWEPIVLAAQRAGINAKYAVPFEGYEGWSNDFLLARGVQKKGLFEAAHQFVNWELAGYLGCKVLEMRGYVVPTEKNITYAESHPDEFDPEVVKAGMENVREKFMMKKGATYWQNVRPKNFKLYEEWWEKLRRA